MSTLAFNNAAGHFPEPATTTIAPCECCGSALHAPVASRHGYGLRRCRNCGVVGVSPTPTADELDLVGRQSSVDFIAGQADLTRLPPSSALWLDNALIQHGVASGRFLDVGCGDGSLIHCMRGLGWNVFGVDVNPQAVAIARCHGLNAIAGTLESAHFADNSMDVAYLGDVIERVSSPRQLLEEIHRILRPRGIVVLRTPNARSGFATITLAASRVLGCAWAHSEAPLHLHEFTRTSLAMLLKSVGFAVKWNRAKGRSRFSQKLAVTGLFDFGKRRMKNSGAFRLGAGVISRLPLIGLAIAGIAGAYAVGRAWDIVTGGGESIFIGARKK
jgi:2-polyprenyl-3-methyl-5-hydroxy-6-metoxy-1,4-benzoquinol methylase